MLPEHDILTIAEVAKYLRLKKTKAYEMVNTGVIPAFRLGRYWRVPRSGLLALVQAGETKVKKG